MKEKVMTHGGIHPPYLYRVYGFIIKSFLCQLYIGWHLAMNIYFLKPKKSDDQSTISSLVRINMELTLIVYLNYRFRRVNSTTSK